MKRFDDFDAWGDAIAGASLRLACDGVDSGVWTHGAVEIGDVQLQMASEGGGNICYGANTHRGALLFVPLTHASLHVVNGERLDEHSVLLIPRETDFRIHVRKVTHAWCSIALPFDVAVAGDSSHRVSLSSSVVRAHGKVQRLRRLVNDIFGSLSGWPADSAAHRSAARDLTAVAVACFPNLSTREEGTCHLGRPRLDRAVIVRHAMAVLDAVATMPTTSELAHEIGVTSRTLLRAFKESFGVAPKKFIMLRELHVVHRSLRSGSPEDTTVAEVLVRHGIWEFGRFAARYRRQFGELPSETLRRARA